MTYSDVPLVGCKSLRRFLQARARRRDAPEGWLWTLHPPVPDKPEENSRGHRRKAIYSWEFGSLGGGDCRSARAHKVMPLQSSRNIVNGMPLPICSPHFNPSSRERVLRAGIILWGSFQPGGRGKKAISSGTYRPPFIWLAVGTKLDNILASGFTSKSCCPPIAAAWLRKALAAPHA